MPNLNRKFFLLNFILILFGQLWAQSNNYWQDPLGLFPILAYNYPDGIALKSEVFKVMKQGGINVFINCNKGWPYDVNKCKEVFDQMNDPTFRWLLIVSNENNDDLIFNNHNNKSNAKINSYLKGFDKNYIYGTYVWDEPHSNKSSNILSKLFQNNDFEDVNKIIKQIRKDKFFSNKLDFVNLLPIYWDQIKTPSDYEKYIDEFIASQEFKPRVLCSDIYPLVNKINGNFRNNYFLNLDILKRKSMQYNIPLWVIVLSAGHDIYVQPTIEQIRMQVYSSLAYGAKGIGYYIYSKSWEKVGYTSWILEKNFDKPGLADSMYGQKYPEIKKLNKDIQAIGKILLKLKPLAVYHSNFYPNNQQGLSHFVFSDPNKNFNLIKNVIEVKDNSATNNSMIGFFGSLEDSNNLVTNFLLVNKDTIYSRTYRININGTANIRRFSKISGRERLIGRNITSFDVTLKPGEGELYRIFNYKK